MFHPEESPHMFDVAAEVRSLLLVFSTIESFNCYARLTVFCFSQSKFSEVASISKSVLVAVEVAELGVHRYYCLR